MNHYNSAFFTACQLFPGCANSPALLLGLSSLSVHHVVQLSANPTVLILRYNGRRVEAFKHMYMYRLSGLLFMTGVEIESASNLQDHYVSNQIRKSL